jgi:hypothetical protein
MSGIGLLSEGHTRLRWKDLLLVIVTFEYNCVRETPSSLGNNRNNTSKESFVLQWIRSGSIINP